MPTVLLIFGLLALGLAWIAAWQAIDRDRATSPRGEWVTYALWTTARIASRLVYRVRREGLENAPRSDADAGPLIVVANHTAGIDPPLIQSSVRFEIRWMMLSEMHVSFVKYLTKVLHLILVAQDGNDLSATREALRTLKHGGVIGVFPEGRIARPPNMLHPFNPGVGFLVARSKARVLPVWISDTPAGLESAFDSLFTRCEARVVFGVIMHFDGIRDPVEITRSILDTFVEMSGWPLADPDEPVRLDGMKKTNNTRSA